MDVRVLRKISLCYPTHHSGGLMVRCRLSALMGRDKLRVADVARLTGLNRSTVTALYNETATRVDLPTIEALCKLFRCQVGDLFLIVSDENGGTP